MFIKINLYLGVHGIYITINGVLATKGDTMVYKTDNRHYNCLYSTGIILQQLLYLPSVGFYVYSMFK